MLWLSITNTSNPLSAIAPNTQPWAVVQKIWQFCNIYGNYKAQPPSQRRQFIIDHEQQIEAVLGQEPGL